MKGTVQNIEHTDWLDVTDPNDDLIWRLHLPFLFSTWQCIFGKGCCGIIMSEDTSYQSDTGCCRDGVYFTQKAHVDEQRKWVAKLTEEDMNPKALAMIQRGDHGWLRVINGNEDAYNAKTRVRQGACVFANRRGEVPEDKIGCAFVHQAARLNKDKVEDADHTMSMPPVCYMLPFKVHYQEYTEGERQVVEVVPWDASEWMMPRDPDYDDFQWWCVDDPAAYGGHGPLFRRYTKELRKILGNPNTHALAMKLLEERYEAMGGIVAKMPAQAPNGRSLIPLAVLGRTERRPKVE